MMKKRGEKPYLTHDSILEKKERSEDRILNVSDVTPLLSRFETKDIDRTCPKCLKTNNNNKIYCYSCLLPVGKPEENVLPHVTLPIKLDILRHPKELKTKSTALHAQVICGSENVRTVELPNVNELTDVDPETTLLLYPSKTALTVSEYPDLSKIQRVVVVDSTWSQANAVLRSELCQKLTKHVKLGEIHPTSFWRYQNKGDDHLATIEAIYYFFRERHEALNNKEYDGRFDNLLYIFVGLLKLIEKTKREQDDDDKEKSVEKTKKEADKSEKQEEEEDPTRNH